MSLSAANQLQYHHSAARMSFSTISKPSNGTTWAIHRDSCTHRGSAPPRIRLAPKSSGGGVTADFEEGQLERPKWTGETPLSRLVRALISFKPLYSVMKLGARQVLISTAEKTSIPWRDMRKHGVALKLLRPCFNCLCGMPHFLSIVLFHECPQRAIKNMVEEALRLLRPGGTFAVTDNSPKSKILQELSPVLFTLMKSTEPFLDEYYLTDLEGVMKQAGFANVQTAMTDPRHTTVTATAPF
ncbi:hypothetical protein SASPL_117220 [Salvia splendens]|uniref:Uncharacterized protein n=1 Tax=Salvia splendens TaxID=180675 RepID=A0A8X8XV46_SALSN|nr:hypothetical protein SASPL_117220 [Salvia splendens]